MYSLLGANSTEWGRFGREELQSGYIHEAPVILHDNLQCESHKPYCPPPLPQSHDCSCYVSKQYWHLHRPVCRNTLIYAHTTSRTVQTCDISLGSLTVPAPEAGDFVELLLL